MLSLPRYQAPPTPISLTEAAPSPQPQAVQCGGAQSSPRHSLPALFSLAKSLLAIMRSRSYPEVAA